MQFSTGRKTTTSVSAHHPVSRLKIKINTAGFQCFVELIQGALKEQQLAVNSGRVSGDEIRERRVGVYAWMFGISDQ